MKFKITRARLLEALQKVQNIVPARSTLQILGNALVRAEREGLWFTTTDLDISIKCFVEAAVEREGATTIPVRRLSGIVREFPEEEIQAEVDAEDHVTLLCGASFVKLIGLPMRDFPPVPAEDGGSCYRIEAGVFREMLRKTSYAVSLDETRRVLTGVLLAFKEGKLTIVATDGRRLALTEHEAEYPPEAETEIVLPIKAVGELMHILRAEGDLRIYARKNQAIFALDGTTLSTKLIDGVYPNYRQVIPSGCDERVTVAREELLTALRRVSLVTTDKANATRLTFADNRLTIVTQTPDVGEARESLPVKYAGKEISIVFNPDYLMDPLRNLDCDEIFIEMSNGYSPALIKCDVPFIYVLMPLRVS
jgi:DNA polymerase-3 subunit beta